jgi:hypothetical protein
MFNMMKRILLLSIPFMLLSCEKQYSGEYAISGFCYDPCSGIPLSGFHVEFRKQDVHFETYTDAKGHFELKGSYQINYNSNKGIPNLGSYSIRDKAGAYKRCSSFSLIEGTKFENDTIFFYHKVNSVYSIKLDSNIVTSNLDTIFFSFSENCTDQILPRYTSYHETDSSRMWFSYHKYFVGPFYHNQILDTMETLIYPHTGYLNENFFNLEYMHIGPNTKKLGFNAAYFSSDNVLDQIDCYKFEPVEIILK